MLAIPCFAYAQSSFVLEALRTQKPHAMQLAEAELAECAKTACPQLANLQLLVGVLHLSKAQLPPALENLKAAAASPSVALAPFAYGYLAQAHAYAGEFPAALLFFDKALPKAPPWLQSKIHLRMAELQFLHRQYAKSLQTLAAQADKSPEALFLAALNHFSMKQYDKAAKPLGQLAVEFPTHPHGLWAEEVLSKPPVSKLPASRRTSKERLLRAHNLLGGGAYAQALAELERLPGQLGPADKAEAALARARIYFAQGKPEQAQQQITLSLKGPPKTTQQASWLMARRHMRNQEHELARQWLAKAVPGGGKLAEEARYMSAWLWLNQSQWKEAEAALGEFADNNPDSSFAVDARWFQGWAQFRQNNCAKARQIWQGAADAYPKSALLPQFQYWAARCAPHNSDDEKAALQLAFENLAGRFPGSLYGRMAQERLPSSKALFPPVLPPSIPPPSLPAELGLAQALAQAGLWADAQNELEALRKRIRGSEDALRIGKAMQSLGAYDMAYLLAARNLWGAAFTRKEKEALSLLFPKAFEAEVLLAGKTHQLPPALIWAVMRRESAFATSALSHANARGLMQIIPPTGQEIAKQLDMTLPSADALFAPALNISFGSWYLKKLVERFGHLAPAVAAYNAGPKAVTRWLSARGTLPLDEWIEEIPFRETRNYVKQVLPDVYAFVEMYPELAETPPPAWTWTLPEPQAEGVNF